MDFLVTRLGVIKVQDTLLLEYAHIQFSFKIIATYPSNNPDAQMHGLHELLI